MANLPKQVFLHYIVDQKINSQSDKETDIFIHLRQAGLHWENTSRTFRLSLQTATGET